MTEEIIPKYVPITETKCGKCKHLKANPTYRKLYTYQSSYPYRCEAHNEALPEIVVNFFGDTCKEFEEK